MTEQKTSPTTPKKPQTEREARLKAALKANLGRRKMQARARKGTSGTSQAKDNE